MKITSEDRRPLRREQPDGPGPDAGDPEYGEAKRTLLETLVTSAAGTQEDLADELGISYATLHAWKTGRRDVPDAALEDLARLALQRSRKLLEAGSRLLRLADVEPPVPSSAEGLRLFAAETRARARAMRTQAREASARTRRRLTRGDGSRA